MTGRVSAASTVTHAARSISGHDQADRLAYVGEPSDGPGAPERVTTYDDDNVGNLLQETEAKGTLTADPDDYATTYRYDELNQVLEARDATLLVRTH